MKNILILLVLIIMFGGVSYSQNKLFEKYCKKIEKTVDKFTGEIEYSTPLVTKGLVSITKQINFSKIINNKSEVIYYMMLSTIGSTAETGDEVILLLENGEKIVKNVKTKVNVNSNAQFEHSAFFRLTEYDIELLKKFKVTDARIYIYDMQITKPEEYLAYINCLETLK